MAEPAVAAAPPAVARDLTSNGVADITFGAIEVVDADRRDQGNGVDRNPQRRRRMITDNTAGIIDMESADLNGDNRPDPVTITSGRTDGDRVSWWPNSQWEKGVGSLSCDVAVS